MTLPFQITRSSDPRQPAFGMGSPKCRARSSSAAPSPPGLSRPPNTRRDPQSFPLQSPASASPKFGRLLGRQTMGVRQTSPQDQPQPPTVEDHRTRWGGDCEGGRGRHDRVPFRARESGPHESGSYRSIDGMGKGVGGALPWSDTRFGRLPPPPEEIARSVDGMLSPGGMSPARRTSHWETRSYE